MYFEINQYGYLKKGITKKDIDKKIYFNNETLDLVKIMPYFYNKAVIYENENYIALMSYATIVSYIDKRNNTLKVNGYYSSTTAKHIQSFAYMYGFNVGGKKELEQELIYKK